MKQAKHAHVFVLVQNERDKYRVALRISNRLLVSLSPESRVCLKENATVFPYSNMFFPQLRRVDMYLSRLSACT